MFRSRPLPCESPSLAALRFPKSPQRASISARQKPNENGNEPFDVREKEECELCKKEISTTIKKYDMTVCSCCDRELLP